MLQIIDQSGVMDKFWKVLLAFFIVINLPRYPGWAE